MNDAEIFDDWMSRHGGRFKREKLPEPRMKEHYRQIEEWAQTLISSARGAVPGLPGIHFDFVLNSEPNAFAFRSRGRYFIGITTGIRYLLELVMFRMLSDSRLLEMIGEPSGEADDLPPLSGYVPRAEDMYRAAVYPIQPRTRARWSYATHLVQQAILFLVGHEIAHISLGHVDFLASKSGSPFIAEVGWIDTDQEGQIERQTLEWQADLRSLASGMASIKLTYESHNLDIPGWAKSPQAPGLLIFHWAFAVNSLFRLLGDGRFNPTNLAGESYPPTPMRRAMLMTEVYGWVMENWKQVPKKAVVAAIRLALQQTEAAFLTILGENATLGGLPEAFSHESRDHHKRLVKYWLNGLSDRVAPFSYEAD
jgi:hypothetical protein